MSFEPPVQQFEFSTELQAKLIALFLRDQHMLGRYRNLIRKEYFTDKEQQALVAAIFSFWDQYQVLPTREAMYDMISRLNDKRYDVERLGQWLNYIGTADLSDQDYLEQQLNNFCKTQEYIMAAMKISKKIATGDFNDISKLVEESEQRFAQTVEEDHIRLFGVTDEERHAKLFTQQPRDCTPTYWPTVNQYTGGPAVSELTVFAAPTGRGKTFALANIAAAAAQQGKWVVFISLEMSAEMISHRICSAYTNLPVDTLAQPQNEGYVHQVLNYYGHQSGGELFVYRFSSTTCSTIKSLITSLEYKYGRKVDMLVVDYADLLTPDNSRDDKRHQLSSIYRDLRAIAINQRLAAVTVSQTNRNSLNKEVITVGDLAECFDKASIADVIWALCQTQEEEKAMRARFFLAKNRNQLGGINVPLSMQLHVSKIVEETYHVR